MALEIPNEIAAAYPNQAELSSATIDAMVAGFAKDGVLGPDHFALAANEGGPPITDPLRWSVGLGQVIMDGRVYGGGNTVDHGPTGTSPRWDMIYFDTLEPVSTNKIKIEPGLADPQPVIPKLTSPNTQVALWAIFLPAETTEFAANPNDHVVDHRVVVNYTHDLKNVRDFGAKGDNVTDDTAAIQAAVDAAAGAPAPFSSIPAGIYFPPGRYGVSSPVTLPGSEITVFTGGFSILGAGSAVSIIVPLDTWKDNAGDDAFIFEATSSGRSRPFVVKGIQLGLDSYLQRTKNKHYGGTGGLPSCGGIFTEGWDQHILIDVKIKSLTGVALKFNGTQEDHFTDVVVGFCGTGGGDGNATSGTPTTLKDTRRVGKAAWEVNQWVNEKVCIISGTGSRTVRTIAANTSDELTVASWTAPDTTSQYVIWISGQATGTQTSTTLQDTNKSWTANMLAGWFVTLVSGTGEHQTREIVSNTGDKLTVQAWFTQPETADTRYVVYKPAVALYRDQLNGTHDPPFDGSSNITAPSNMLLSSFAATLNYGPSMLMYTDHEAGPFVDNVVRTVFFNGFFGHGQAGNPWPLFDMHFENAWSVELLSGKTGNRHLRPDDMFPAGTVATAFIEFVGNEHKIHDNVVSSNFLVNAMGPQSGTAYIIRTVGSVQNENNEFSITMTNTSNIVATKLIQIGQDASAVEQRTRIPSIRVSSNWVNKVVQLDNGALVMGRPLWADAIHHVDAGGGSGQSSANDYPIVELTSTETMRMTMPLPPDFLQLVELYLVFIPEISETISDLGNFQLSSYSAGEVVTAGSSQAITSIGSVIALQLEEFDILNNGDITMPALRANDLFACQFESDHSNIRILGIRGVYV